MKNNNKNAKSAPVKNKELGAGLTSDLMKQLASQKSTKSNSSSSNVKIVMVNSGSNPTAKAASAKPTTKKATEPKKTVAPTKKISPAKPELKKAPVEKKVATSPAQKSSVKGEKPKTTTAKSVSQKSNVKTAPKSTNTKTANTKVETKAKAPAKTVSKSTTVTKSATPEKKSTVTTITKPKKSTVVSDGEFLSLKTERVGNFEIKKSKDGRFVFNLYAANHSIVATSQIYSSSAAAMNGIKSVIINASTSPIEDQTLKNYQTLNYPKWEIYLDKGDQYRFRLSASNGSCVCHSQGYTNKANCKNGIESIIRLAADANIKKKYLEK